MTEPSGVCVCIRRARARVVKQPLHNTEGDLRKKSMPELYDLLIEAGFVICLDHVVLVCLYACALSCMCLCLIVPTASARLVPLLPRQLQAGQHSDE